MEYGDGVITVSKKDVTVVIPTLNEEEAIGLVIDELVEYGFPKENILVVDGYSTDNTLEIARSRGVRCILQHGEGKADAILSAARYVETPYMLVMDGDYTYDPKGIDEMLRRLPGHSEVIGYRLYGRENISRLHRFGNWILTKVFNLIFGTSLNDVCSGMYVVRTDVVKGLIGKSKGFSIEVEIAAAASHEGDIIEIPINYRERIGDNKLRTFKDGPSILWNIIRISWWYNPIFLIFAMGSLLLIPSLIVMGYVAYEYLFLGVKHFVWAILSVAGATAGVISLMLCLVSLYIKRMERRIIVQLRELERIVDKHDRKRSSVN